VISRDDEVLIFEDIMGDVRELQQRVADHIGE